MKKSGALLLGLAGRTIPHYRHKRHSRANLQTNSLLRSLPLDSPINSSKPQRKHQRARSDHGGYTRFQGHQYTPITSSEWYGPEHARGTAFLCGEVQGGLLCEEMFLKLFPKATISLQSKVHSMLQLRPGPVREDFLEEDLLCRTRTSLFIIPPLWLQLLSRP
ncbi:hypothetical protein HS088_TW12G00022 [Tripterygium wilfordii]|uniref:Uncharacterized protein n=1 Tax=Tripterygium wilfordii TaxID=458696 RepID=A0A7J7CY03_TRIWF|nr:hypothetical protein HS088_TW12G00022 [Tripterygium wilfordii]